MNIAVVLAAGKSKRFGKTDKLFALIGDQPILAMSIGAFQDHFLIDKIIVVGNRRNLPKIIRLVKSENFSKVSQISIGQKTRQGSLENGLKSKLYHRMKMASPRRGKLRSDLAVVHNGANPFVTDREITDCIIAAKKSGAAFVGWRPNNTIRIREKSGFKILPRENIIFAETPQAIRCNILKKGMAYAKKHRLTVTDDVAFAELVGVRPTFVLASPQNRKITFSEDLKNFRVGTAIDTHEFSRRRQRGLTLGGIKFVKHLKLEADSDGDVILHAIAAAISQAHGKGSLGTFAAAMCKKGIKDSKKYLPAAKLYNIGIHLETSGFPIDPLVPRLKKSLAKIVKLSESNIGITASHGQKNTIRCIASVTVAR